MWTLSQNRNNDIRDHDDEEDEGIHGALEEEEQQGSLKHENDNLSISNEEYYKDSIPVDYVNDYLLCRCNVCASLFYVTYVDDIFKESLVLM